MGTANPCHGQGVTRALAEAVGSLPDRAAAPRLTRLDPDPSIHSPALPAPALPALWHIPSTNERRAVFSGTAGEAGCQWRQWGSPASPELNQPCTVRASLDVLAGPCRCLRAVVGSWDTDFQEIILSFFLLASPASFKAG